MLLKPLNWFGNLVGMREDRKLRGILEARAEGKRVRRSLEWEDYHGANHGKKAEKSSIPEGNRYA